jgi:hypothetical protein
VSKPLSLEDYVASAEDLEEADILMHVTGLVPPKTIENLRRLRRLALLRDEVLLSLVGQAPIDPCGIFGALQGLGSWTFQPVNFTAIQILAKKGSKPVALMQIDLLSDDITFIALKAGQLVVHSTLEADAILTKLHETGMTEARLLEWLKDYIDAAIKGGMEHA